MKRSIWKRFKKSGVNCKEATISVPTCEVKSDIGVLPGAIRPRDRRVAAPTEIAVGFVPKDVNPPPPPRKKHPKTKNTSSEVGHSVTTASQQHRGSQRRMRSSTDGYPAHSTMDAHGVHLCYDGFRRGDVGVTFTPQYTAPMSGPFHTLAWAHLRSIPPSPRLPVSPSPHLCAVPRTPFRGTASAHRHKRAERDGGVGGGGLPKRAHSAARAGSSG